MPFNILIWDDETDHAKQYINILDCIQKIAPEVKFHVRLDDIIDFDRLTAGIELSKDPKKADINVVMLSDDTVESVVSSGDTIDLAILDENYSFIGKQRYGSEIIAPKIKAANSNATIIVATYHSVSDEEVAAGLKSGVVSLWIDKKNLASSELDVPRILATLAISLWNNKKTLLKAEELQQDVEIAEALGRIFNIVKLKDLPTKSPVDYIVGSTPAMRVAYHFINLYANTDAAVFLSGETGVGKQVFARAIHDMSPRKRKGGRFFRIVCGGVASDETLYSQIFGHEKGSFTGANAKHDGYVTVYSDGTLFLDEIGDISEKLQNMLMQFLDDGTYTPLGANFSKTSEARIITATNKDIRQLVREGRFRDDLMYRLNIQAPFVIPPLREHKDDIPLIAKNMIEKSCSARNIDSKYVFEFINDAFYMELSKLRWPGNVRELESCIERMILISGGEFSWLSNTSKLRSFLKTYSGDNDVSENTYPIVADCHHEYRSKQPSENMVLKANKSPVFASELTPQLGKVKAKLDEFEKACALSVIKYPNARITKKFIAEPINKTPQSITDYFSKKHLDIKTLDLMFPSSWRYLRQFNFWDETINKK